MSGRSSGASKVSRIFIDSPNLVVAAAHQRGHWIVVAIGRREFASPRAARHRLLPRVLGGQRASAIRVWSGLDAANATALVWTLALAAAAGGVVWRLPPLRRLHRQRPRCATEYGRRIARRRALAQVNAELRRLDELKSEVLAIGEHELRTPLTAIIGYSRAAHAPGARRLTPSSSSTSEDLRGAQRLSDLINDLIDVSRLEAGRVDTAAAPRTDEWA